MFDYHTVLSTCQDVRAQSGGLGFGAACEVSELVRQVFFFLPCLRNTSRLGAGNCIISPLNQQAAVLLKECVCMCKWVGGERSAIQ